LSFFSYSSVFASVIVKAIERPSGDQAKFDTPLLTSVSGAAAPPVKIRR
jgi:hypothetical protein